MRAETRREFWLRLLREFEEREKLIQKVDANDPPVIDKNSSNQAA